jgi:pilus assembly protein Flp/PilA
MLDMLKVAAWYYLPALRRDTRGVTALEYGILAGLIAVVIIGAVTSLGTSLSTMFTGIAATISGIPTK